MRSCVADGQTDGRTGGAGYIGPAEGYGGSKKGLKRDLSSRKNATDKFCNALFFQTLP